MGFVFQRDMSALVITANSEHSILEIAVVLEGHYDHGVVTGSENPIRVLIPSMRHYIFYGRSHSLSIVPRCMWVNT
jgi:hypothetical protein